MVCNDNVVLSLLHNHGFPPNNSNMFFRMFEKNIILLSLIVFVKIGSTQVVQRCSYQVPDGQKTDLTFTNKLWSVHTSDYSIYYTLCGVVPFNLGSSQTAAALIKKTKDEYDFYTNLGSSYVSNSDKGASLRTVYGTKCPFGASRNYSLIINFQCSEQMTEQPILVPNNDICVFEIVMMHPTCSPKCTYRVLENFIDLRPFNGSHSVKTEDGRNFTMALCGPTPKCGRDRNISVCELNANNVVPIATYESINMGYNVKKESIYIHGDVAHAVTRKKTATFKLFFKCNWETLDKNLHLIKKPTQKAYFDFEIESSVGCATKHIPCVITNNFLIYNLSKLYSPKGKWTVKNYSKSGKLWLNFCGPLLNLPTETHNKCTDTHAQVCENENGSFTNKGTVFSGLKLDGDVIEATFEDGMRCREDPSRNYKTNIRFYCDRNETGPYFDRSDKCDTFINWRTPEACPQYNETACHKDRSEFDECKFVHGNQTYDLSPLTSVKEKTRGYVVRNGTNSFMINPCGTVFDEDSPCMKDVSVAMKDLKQFNKKYSVVSLGKYNTVNFSNDNIIIDYRFGSYCTEGGQDYKSEIHFSCSDTEEGPVLLDGSNCAFVFSWKTKTACPVIKKCRLLDFTTNTQVEFDRINTTVPVKNSNITYTFDICQDHFTICNENCNRTAYTSKITDLPYIKMSLPKNCESPEDFNKVEVSLHCDHLVKSPKFEHFKKSDCTLRFSYVAQSVCSLIKNRETTVLREAKATTQIEEIQEITTKKSHKSKLDIINLMESNCSLTNNKTGYKFYFSKIQLYFTKTCPYVTAVNDTSRIIKLKYQTDDKCRNKTKNNETFYYYDISLRCVEGLSTQSNEAHPDQCFDKFQYDQFEFCNFFIPFSIDNKTVQSAALSATSISFAVLIITMALILITVGIYKKTGCGFSRRSEYCQVYFKNGNI